jgi:hypothetical protein
MPIIYDKQEKRSFENEEKKVSFLEGLLMAYETYQGKLRGNRHIYYEFGITNDQGDVIYSNAHIGPEVSGSRAGIYPYAAFVQDAVVTSHILDINNNETLRGHLEKYVQKLMDEGIIPSGIVTVKNVSEEKVKEAVTDLKARALVACQEYIEEIEKMIPELLERRNVKYDSSHMGFRILIRTPNGSK